MVSGIIEELLEKEYWVIDILPKQVPGDRGGQYFEVEKFYLSPPQLDVIHGKFSDIVLRLNCYYDIHVCCDCEDAPEKNPDPGRLAGFMGEGFRKGSVFVLFESESSLLFINGDDTHMTLYNPSAELLELVKALAAAAGLFVWKPKQS